MSESLVYDRHNLRFTASKMRPSSPDDETWYVWVTRISSGLHLSPQTFLAREPTPDELELLAEAWIMEKAGNDDPPPTPCAACGLHLTPDHADTDYQFDNALWIHFHGGYGMFVESPDFTNGELKAVICHDCAHRLCAENPWLDRLLDPIGSHAHRQPEPYETLKAEGHRGWDIDRATMGE